MAFSPQTHHTLRGQVGLAYQPETQAKTYDSKCRKSCCWTPFKCAKDLNCNCHKKESN